MMGVRATGRQSFKQEALGVFCIGTMVDVLKHWETTESVEGVELVSVRVCVPEGTASPLSPPSEK